MELPTEQTALIFPLSQRPEWRADPAAMTFLKTDRGLATKKWIADREEPTDCAMPILWLPFVARADGIEQLAAILDRAAEFPRLEAILGAVRESSVHNQLVNRRIIQHPNEPAPDIEDVARHWLMIDLDSVPEPEDLAWRGDTRRAAIWAARNYLPPAFRRTAFYYRYSASAGIRPGLRLHFWFWINEPRTSRQLHRYFDPFKRAGVKLDLALYSANQPHFTADPIFIRREDPMMACGRSGVVI